MTIGAVELCSKIQKQLQNLSPNKIKTVVSNFILNHINNFIDHAKIYI